MGYLVFNFCNWGIVMNSSVTRKRALAASTAVALVFYPLSSPAQVMDTAGQDTKLNPKPLLEEELVLLRDRLAVQAIRLEQAEQTIERLEKLAAHQSGQIALIEADLPRVAAFPDSDGAGVHIVRSGDTLYRIATRYKVDVADIAKANGLKNANRLRLGQQLVIPGAALAAAPAPAVSAGTAAPAKSAPATKPAPVIANAAGAKPPQPQTQLANVQTDRPPAQAKPASGGAEPEAVGQRPDEDLDEPYLALASDVGGILTPQGTLYFEPEIDFSNSSENRFFFSGVEIVDAILIGVIEATDTDRMALVARAGLRYGLNDRLEIDAKVPWVYRDDRVAGVALDDNTEFVRDLRGAGLGDVEIGMHYQLTDGGRFPYTIANLRAKAPTGEGPFDVDRTPSGIELDAATGSGFWTIEPSLTFILPTDPAVFFANIGYQHNFAISPDEQIGGAIVREFNPGDAIRTSLGVGLAVNERLSLNFGYDQSHFFPTILEIETIDQNTGDPVLTRARQPRVTVGSFGVGGSYYVNDRLRLNLNTSFGATDEAPDLRLVIRAQLKLFE